jgi:hypothetical protein
VYKAGKEIEGINVRVFITVAMVVLLKAFAIVFVTLIMITV